MSAPESLYSPHSIISRGGPAAGGGLSMLGALMAMAGFLLPWASCSGQSVSGWQMAQSPGPQGQNLALLYLVPFLALICLGIALSLVPLSLWRRVPLVVPYLAASLMGLLAAGAAVPLVVVFTSLRAAQQQAEDALGPFAGFAGDVIKIENGFWITAAGLALVALGALGALAAMIIGLLLPKRRRLP